MDKPEYAGWTVVREIGHGSFSTVYEIERDLFGSIEKAALKVIPIPTKKEDIDDLRSQGFSDDEIKQGFKRMLERIASEYKFMAELGKSAHIVNCDDFQFIQKDDGFSWIVYIRMELLAPLINSLKPSYDEESVLKIGVELCAALYDMECKDILHGDIKPENIFVSEDGSYKLGDFGLAFNSNAPRKDRVGTYNYMAPEVYQENAYSAKSDIYSLGMTLYWLMNDRTGPFLPAQKQEVTSAQKALAAKKRFDGDPLPAPRNGGEELKKIVLKACSYDPKDRFISASDMLIALDNYADQKLREEKKAEKEMDPQVIDVLIKTKAMNYTREGWRNATTKTTMITSLASVIIAMTAFLFGSGILKEINPADNPNSLPSILASSICLIIAIVVITVQRVFYIRTNRKTKILLEKKDNPNDQKEIKISKKSEKSTSFLKRKPLIVDTSYKKVKEETVAYNAEVLINSMSDKRTR